MIRTGRAAWWGALKGGSGVIWTGTGVLKEAAYGFGSRFGEGPGTSPEELIAAAHAASFSMALSMILGEAGLVPESVETRASVTLEPVENGCEITDVHLDVCARVAGVENSMFQGLAHKARNACPVSRLLKAHVTVDARLLA